MNKGLIALGAVIVVIIFILGGIFSLYNGLKESEISVDAAYGQVENQMQRRSDLIPNLVNTVKGYDVHEKAVIEEVVAGSSHRSVLPKNLIAPLPYRITRGGVPEACCPFSRCTPKKRDGEDLLGGAMIWNNGEKSYEAAAARVDVCLTI